MDKNHKDLDVIDLSEPRRAQYMHKAWKRHQNSVLGRHQSCYEERIEVLSDTIESNDSSRNTSVYCNPKVVRMETREVMYENVHMSPRPHQRSP